MSATTASTFSSAPSSESEGCLSPWLFARRTSGIRPTTKPASSGAGSPPWKAATCLPSNRRSRRSAWSGRAMSSACRVLIARPRSRTWRRWRAGSKPVLQRGRSLAALPRDRPRARGRSRGRRAAVSLQGVPSPGTTKTIYYALDAASGIVKVFALLDQRRNPANRFRGIDESRLEDF